MIRCPNCNRPVDDQAVTCYCCGYSIVDARKMFGENLVQMPRLHDAAHCLRKQDRDDVSEVLDLLEGRFPQLSFCAYLGALQPGVKLRELGFWLLNHVTVGGLECSRPNENAVLLLLDINSKQAGITLGYFTESLLDESDCYAILQKTRPHLMSGEYGTALLIFYKKLARVLSRRARMLEKLPPEVRNEIPDRSLDVPIQTGNTLLGQNDTASNKPFINEPAVY